MRDSPLCHERFRVCAAPAARRSAFYLQNSFPPMLPTGDKSGWHSDYSSRGRTFTEIGVGGVYGIYSVY
jgi:hypothetical protein